MASFVKSQDDGVRVFCVWSEGNPEISLAQLEKHVKHGLINPDDFDRAVLRNEGLTRFKDYDNPKEYPLKLQKSDSAYRKNNYMSEVWVSAMTAGYDGSGPRCAVEALRLMGFEVSDADVFEMPIGEEKHFYK